MHGNEVEEEQQQENGAKAEGEQQKDEPLLAGLRTDPGEEAVFAGQLQKEVVARFAGESFSGKHVRFLNANSLGCHAGAIA